MYRMLLMFSACLSLTACSLGGGSLPVDHFYRLTPVELQAVDTPLLDHILLKPVKVSGLLNDRAMLYSESSSSLELKAYHYHYWADAPAYLIQSALYQGLSSAQLATRVSRETTHSSPELSINSRLLRFERHLEADRNTVVVELEVWVQYSDSSKQPWNKVYRSQLYQQQSPLYAAVESFSLATQNIVQQLVDDLLIKK